MKQSEQSLTQTNAKEQENKPNYLIEKFEVEGTPLVIIKKEGSIKEEWNVTFGMYKFNNETLNNLEECKKYVNDNYMNITLTLCTITMEAMLKTITENQ